MYKLLIAVFAMLMITGSAFAQTDDTEDAKQCYFCGMYWDKSSTRSEMVLTVDGETDSYPFESIGCAFNAMKEMKADGAKEVKVESATILDYSTYGTDAEMMVDAGKAWYLVGTSKLPGSMGPFVAAFGAKDVAIQMKKKMGGELMNHDEMAEHMMGDDKKMEGHGDMHEGMPGMGDSSAEVWVCSCSGGCCDDIQSDKPGKCSKCGMDLVKKTDK